LLNIIVFGSIIESSWNAPVATLTAQYGASSLLNYDNLIEPELHFLSTTWRKEN